MTRPAVTSPMTDFLAVINRFRAEFDPEELAAVLSRYDIGAIKSVEKQLKGSRRSPKMIVEADRGRFLLKRRARGRDHPVKVAFSHAVQLHLLSEGFPLPQLVPVVGEDDTMVIIDDRLYEMFEFVGGGVYGRTLSETRDGGRVLGMFHRLLKDYHTDWGPSRLGYHNADIVRTNLQNIPETVGKDDSVAGREGELFATVSSLYESYSAACERTEEVGFKQWRDQLVHSDWHPGNMLFADGRVRAVIDYDSLHMLPAVTDLANGLLQFSIVGGAGEPQHWPAELDRERFVEFFRGYNEEFTIPPDQLAVVTSLMVEALVAEAVAPIAATGTFGRIEGFRFLQMIGRKVRWIERNGESAMKVAQ
ncbi:MAG: phosphotransferase [Planctomycetes bacterium]|nr:phosphotransferase [Planctomycetota bacterium]